MKFRPKNWLAETWKQEMLRRIEALESSVSELKLSANRVDNDILELQATQEAEIERSNRLEGI